MSLAAGDRLGPYEIVAPIGAGGMGEVFRATDTRLGRPVAIKICREKFGGRFEQEARAIAALNHPHICTLYDVGPNYLVMELVEGETLAARLKRGRLPLPETLKFGRQIATALAAAHSKGIVHRDLKPGNIILAKSGAKVLDFGLAKTSESDETQTVTGVVVGTPAYLAPEQREGKACDARTDIYALGLMLREMATGKRAAEVEDVPAALVRVIQTCVETDPAERWQSAWDLGKELEWLSSEPRREPADAGRRFSTRLVLGIGAIAGLGLLLTAVTLLRREPATDLGPSEFFISFQNTDPGSLLGGFVDTPVPSPDGKTFVFRAPDSHGTVALWTRSLGSLEERRLAGTDGTEGTTVWSWDGQWIAFYAGGKLKKVKPSGGTPQTIAELPGFQEAAWGPRGEIIYRPSNRMSLYQIRDSGGPSRPLTSLNKEKTENSHRSPQFLPGGRRFLFVARCGDRANNALYIGSLDSPEVKRVMPAQSKVRYLPPKGGRPGALIYYRDGGLVAQQFDADKGQISGETVSILSGVGYAAPSILALFNTSQDGRVIIAGPPGAFNSRLVWFRRDGKEEGAVGSPGEYQQPRISPTGDRVVYESPDPQNGNRDLYYTEFARGITHRLTTHVANDWYPVWSPDGRQILFGTDRDGTTDMRPYLKTSMDPGSSESRFSGLTVPPNDWSRDGKWIAGGANDIWIAPVSAAPGFQFLATPAVEQDARFSPDTKWLAYSSNESGREEIYVRPFDGKPAAPTGKIQISNEGGEYPVWGPAGKEIFYMNGSGDILAFDASRLGKPETVLPPARLFKACPDTHPFRLPLTGAGYDYSFDTYDGQRFLVVCRAEPPGRYTVLLNWELRK